MTIWFADDDFTPFIASTYDVPSAALPPPRDPIPGWFQNLAVGDLQGRSLPVGRPDIVTVEKYQQATLILAAPPMHVEVVGRKLKRRQASKPRTIMTTCE